MAESNRNTTLLIVGLMLTVIGLSLFNIGGFHWALTYGTQVLGLVFVVVAAGKLLGT